MGLLFLENFIVFIKFMFLINKIYHQIIKLLFPKLQNSISQKIKQNLLLETNES